MALAVDRIDTWIYVTGVPRCGSTFVGKVLSHPLSVDYIHEPFNPLCSIEGLSEPYLYVRLTLDTASMQAFHEGVQRLLRYDVRLKTLVPPQDPLWRRVVKRMVGSRGPVYLRLAQLNPFHRAAVIKDPTGALAADYLQARHGVKPVVVVRHPVSLAASHRRVGWHPTLAPLAAQPALVEDFFDSPEERAFLERPWDDLIEAVAARWRVVYGVLLRQAEAAEAAGHPWHIVTHEAVSAAPVPTFRGLYDALGLPWSARVERHIRKLTENDTAEAREGRVHDFRRDSAALFAHRRQQLSPEERRRIFALTADVALRFYDRASFALDEGPDAGTPEEDGSAGPAPSPRSLGAPNASGR